MMSSRFCYNYKDLTHKPLSPFNKYTINVLPLVLLLPRVNKKIVNIIVEGHEHVYQMDLLSEQRPRCSKST